MPAKAVCQAIEMLDVPTPSRASPAPTGFCGVHITCGWHQSCGSWLASESGVSGNRDAGCTDAFASRLAPTGFCGVHNTCGWHQSCRRWLASESGVSGNRDAGCTVAFASRLAPTGFCGVHNPCGWHQSCRRWLASESGVSGKRDAGCADAIAGKPAPTGYRVYITLLGASRLAMAVCQAPSSVRRTLSSSSLIWNGLTSISMPLPRNT